MTKWIHQQDSCGLILIVFIEYDEGKWNMFMALRKYNLVSFCFVKFQNHTPFRQNRNFRGVRKVKLHDRYEIQKEYSEYAKRYNFYRSRRFILKNNS